jgi:hypothetical protein
MSAMAATLRVLQVQKRQINEQGIARLKTGKRSYYQSLYNRFMEQQSHI